MENIQTLSIRSGVISDAPQLYLWDEKPHVRAAVSESGERSFSAKWEDELTVSSDESEFFIAEVDGKPIGAMQIIDPALEPTHYWGAVAPNLRAIDIWIGEEDFLGRGYGGQMMRFAIEHCFANNDVNAIIIDPLAKNTDSHRFYKRLGFQFVERRQFDEESNCFVFKLSRDNWNDLNN